MLTTQTMLSIAHQLDRYYSQVIGEVAEKYRISRIEIDVLLFLHNNPEYDTARDIVEYRFLTKSYVSKAVDLLTRRGFLEITEDKADRRILHLKLLPEAEGTLTAAREAQERVYGALKQGISSKEQALAGRLLLKMSENIRKQLQ